MIVSLATDESGFGQGKSKRIKCHVPRFIYLSLQHEKGKEKKSLEQLFEDICREQLKDFIGVPLPTRQYELNMRIPADLHTILTDFADKVNVPIGTLCFLFLYEYYTGKKIIPRWEDIREFKTIPKEEEPSNL